MIRSSASAFRSSPARTAISRLYPLALSLAFLPACATDAPDDIPDDKLGAVQSAIGQGYIGVAGARIVNGNGLCLRAEADGSVKQQFCTADASTQHWLTRQTSTGVEIRNVGNGKCLDIPFGTTTARSPLQTHTCHDGANQRFRGTLGTLSAFTPSTNAAVCFDVTNNNATPGETLQLFACNGQLNQQFNVRLGPTPSEEFWDSNPWDEIMEFTSTPNTRIGPGETRTLPSFPDFTWITFPAGNALDFDDDGNDCDDAGTKVIQVTRFTPSTCTFLVPVFIGGRLTFQCDPNRILIRCFR